MTKRIFLMLSLVIVWTMVSVAGEWAPKFYSGLEAAGTVKTVSRGYRGTADCVELRHVSGGFKFGAEKTVESNLKGAVDWSVAADISCFGGGEVQVGMEFFDADGRLLDARLGQPVKASDWTRESWTFHANARVAKATVQILSVAAGGVRFANVTANASPSTDVEIPLAVSCWPVETTMVWNDGKAVFNTFADAPLPLTFRLKGDRCQLKDPALELDLPAELEVTDAFTDRPRCYRAEVPTVTEIVRENRAYRRYRFAKARVFDFLETNFAWGREIVVLIEPRGGTPIPAKFPVYFRGADGTRAAEEKAFELSMTKLPAHLRQPKNFSVFSWEEIDRACSRDDVFCRMIRAYEAAGCTTFRRPDPEVTRGHELVRILKDRKARWIFPSGFNDFTEVSQNHGPEYEKLAVRLALNDKGEKTKRLCPEYFNTDPAFLAYLRKHITDVLKQAGVEDGDWITLDYEPWQSSHYCFCETCLKAFAAFAGLSAPPAVKDIADKYLDTWAQFRIRHCEETIRLTCETIRAYNPKLVICDYDYILFYGTEQERNFYRNCAKDSRLNEKWFDLHFCSYYHILDQRAFDALRNNTRELKKTYIPIASSDGIGYLGRKEVRHPRQIRQLALAAFVHGCPGLAFYRGQYYDGAQLFALMKARDEVAALEDLPWGRAEGSLRADSSEKQLSFATTVRDGREVIALFNYNRAASAAVKILSSSVRMARRVLDPVSGETLAENVDLQKGFEVSVPKEGVRFVEIRP